MIADMENAGYNFAVIGDPVQHSLSDKLHNYLMESVNINGTYSKIQVSDKETLEIVISQLRNKTLTGINVTSPWKQAVVTFADKSTAIVNTTGAANTLKLESGSLVAHNTDGYGFQRWYDKMTADRDVKKVLILGAGGAVRGILHSFMRKDSPHIRILNRSRQNVYGLISLFGDDLSIDYQGYNKDNLINNINTVDVIINALPASARNKFGIDNMVEQFRSDDPVYLDLNYGVEASRLVNRMQNFGISAGDGLPMLVYQGIESMKFWLSEKKMRGIQPAEIIRYLRGHHTAQ